MTRWIRKKKRSEQYLSKVMILWIDFIYIWKKYLLIASSSFFKGEID